MNSRKKIKVKKELTENLAMVITVIVTIVLLTVATVVIVNTVHDSLYSERKESLGEITEASAKTVNEVVKDQRAQTTMLKNVIAQELPGEVRNVEDYVSDLADQLQIDNDLFFLVDSNGRYYCSDGHKGRMTDRTYYVNSSDNELEYLSSLPHMTGEKTYLIFRFRLEKPVTAEAEGNPVQIRYFAMMHDLDQLNETVSELFEGTNNTFIYEKDTGTMLYKQFGMGILINGYVIYPKLNGAVLTHEEQPEKLIEKCRNGKTVVVEMEIDGKSYYFCSANLEVQNWALAFVVHKGSIEESSGSGFNSVIYAVLIFAALLSLTIILVVVMTIRMKNNKREQAALEKINAAKTSFLFNMSHDIRTPMNAIIGFTNIAMKHIDDKEKVMDSLKKTQYSGNLLLALINDILDVSRIESGNVTLNETGGDILDIFNDTRTVLSDTAKDKNIELTYETGDVQDINVLLDEARFQRVLINVISNGIKYTPAGGYVHVSMEQLVHKEDEGVYRFTVEDNGVGMSPEFQKHLFEEFTREENSTTSGIQGTGLGLSLCKSILDLMGGTIECESVQGEGSTFTITIPVRLHDEEAAAGEVEPPAEEEIDLNGGRVLIVEDNELNREIAVDILQDIGLTADEAENGQVALEMLEKSGTDTYDFILMDIQMPVMDGYEASMQIRKMFPEWDVPIIALSANAFEEDRKKSREAGMTEHIAKPVNVEELYEALKKHRRNGGSR